MLLQPLQLCLNSMQSIKVISGLALNADLKVMRTTEGKSTFFPAIGRTICHDWIDPKVIASATSTADKSPVKE